MNAIKVVICFWGGRGGGVYLMYTTQPSSVFTMTTAMQCQSQGLLSPWNLSVYGSVAFRMPLQWGTD